MKEGFIISWDIGQLRTMIDQKEADNKEDFFILIMNSLDLVWTHTGSSLLNILNHSKKKKLIKKHKANAAKVFQNKLL